MGMLRSRLANRWAQKDEAPAEEQQAAPEDQAAPAPEQAADQPQSQAEPAPAPAETSLGGQLQQLATLKDQGILSDDEFTAAKAKLLGL